jgi:hypothetical protein
MRRMRIAGKDIQRSGNECLRILPATSRRADGARFATPFSVREPLHVQNANWFSDCSVNW